jgi:NADH-quinone oxidoreductase subunit M
MLQRVNMGTLPDHWREAGLRDVLAVEWVSWAPLLALILVLGLYPRLVFGITDEAVSGLMTLLGS